MKKLYKGRHWVASGGFHFIQRTRNHQEIFAGEVKEKLTEVLQEVAQKFKMLDVTIKIYPSNFHLFFFCHGHAPIEITNAILNAVTKMLKEEFNLKDVIDDVHYISTVDEISPEFIQKLLMDARLEK